MLSAVNYILKLPSPSALGSRPLAFCNGMNESLSTGRGCPFQALLRTGSHSFPFNTIPNVIAIFHHRHQHSTYHRLAIGRGHPLLLLLLHHRWWRYRRNSRRRLISYYMTTRPWHCSWWSFYYEHLPRESKQ